MRGTRRTKLGTLEDWMEKSTFMRPVEAAAEFRISKSKIYDMLAKGELPSIRLGGVLRIPRAAIERLAAEALED
jgi:excisionase family DNA binding protein